MAPKKPKKSTHTFAVGDEVIIKANGDKARVISTSLMNQEAIGVETAYGVVTSFHKSQLVSVLDTEFAAVQAKVKENLAKAYALLSETQTLVGDNDLDIRLSSFDFVSVEDIVGEMSGRRGWSSSDC